jgi:hypothetical protein
MINTGKMINAGRKLRPRLQSLQGGARRRRSWRRCDPATRDLRRASTAGQDHSSAAWVTAADQRDDLGGRDTDLVLLP